jgi:methyltransferase-like protein/2-polyprenyl-3-methyl-5-hydroxy-6-metoxy-1,4-benzoquinol methylase
MSSSTTSYDDVPYPVYVFPQTHPDRLATIAALLDLNPPPVQRCRVLELGCAAGGNLIPMAEELPEASFVGIDLSPRQVAEGQKWIAELGLRNIELRQQSILDFDAGADRFDYILCHGVYAWVPAAVQDRILTICQEALHAEGIAFISYNTLPGWHMRGMIRDMMLYHGRHFAEPRQKVAQCLALLDFIGASVKTETTPYAQFLRSQIELLRKQDDSYLFHEFLEEYNTPLYLYQFVERAIAHDLRYLADADLCTMEFRTLPTEVREGLQRLYTDLVQLEQYLDFLRNRTFRQTLLCRGDRQPKYRIDPTLLRKFFVGSPLRPCSAQPDLHSSTFEQFQDPSGANASSRLPIVKAALTVLGEHWPQVVAFPELCSRALAKLHTVAANEAALLAEEEQLAQTLLHLYTSSSGVVDLRLRPLPMTTQPGDQPLARPLARWQAKSGTRITNCRHETLTIDAFARQVLMRLDGQHTQSALVAELATLIDQGQFTLQQNGEVVRDGQSAKPMLAASVQRQLESFIRNAVLLA